MRPPSGVFRSFIYIYAEACNELGEDIDEAYKLVNTVRERSFYETDAAGSKD